MDSERVNPARPNEVFICKWDGCYHVVETMLVEDLENNITEFGCFDSWKEAVDFCVICEFPYEFL